jgi:hypothetical protein
MGKAALDMATWQTPTLNWTPQDRYNYWDYNRVENNTIAVSQLLALYGYINALQTTITSRTNLSLDFYDSLNRIETNILILLQTLLLSIGYMPSAWIPPVTNWTYDVPFDYNTPNRWEQNLNLIYAIFNNVITEYKYCGASNSVCGTDATYL